MKNYVLIILILIVMFLGNSFEQVSDTVYADDYNGVSLALKVGEFSPRVDLNGGSGLTSKLDYELGIGLRPHTNIGGELSVGRFSYGFISSVDNSTLEKTYVTPLLATIKLMLPFADEALTLSTGGGIGYYLFTFPSDAVIKSNSVGYHIMSSVELPLSKGFLFGIEARWTYIGGDYKQWFGTTITGLLKFML